MGFGLDYLDYFHYSDSRGYLIFCCHSVAMMVLFEISNIYYYFPWQILADFNTQKIHREVKTIS